MSAPFFTVICFEIDYLQHHYAEGRPYTFQELFPVSEEAELISLDIDSLISALGDSDTTVREAAMACSIAILSKYYDCMPFAGRSKLLSIFLRALSISHLLFDPWPSTGL